VHYKHKVWVDCAVSKKRFPFALWFWSGVRDQRSEIRSWQKPYTTAVP